MAEVVLVDDDRTNTALIKMLLEMDGFQVTVCPTLRLARAKISATTAALIVDYHLSGDDKGVTIIHEVRAGQTPAAVDAPIIATSGDDRRKRETYDAGANLFLLKPYLPSKLSEELAALLAKGTDTSE